MITPPDWIDRFLEWYCADDYLDEVQGDLHEWYAKKVRTRGKRMADLQYALAVFQYISLFRLKPFQKLMQSPNYLSMKSIFKITFRHLNRSKLSSFIRLGNLTLGVGIFLLAYAYARYELSYDQFHEKKDRLFRVGMSFSDKAWGATSMGMGAYVLENVPEVVRMTRFMPIRNTRVRYGDKQFYEKDGFYADSAVFSMFSYRMKQGNPATALIDPLSIVLTESLARKYFGSENPIGKWLELSADMDRDGNITPRVVTGVMEDVPEQSHLQFDYICSPYDFDPDFLTRWRNFWVYTYVELEENAGVDNLKKMVVDEFMALRNITEDMNPEIETIMTPVTKIHLYTNHEKEYADNGNIIYIYILFSIGLFVLIISSINFVNLSIIKGLDRAREVGIRKTVGASKQQLVIQFLSENLILLVIAGTLGVLLLAIITPVFQQFSGLALPTNVFRQPDILIPLVLVIFLLQVAGGLYPALVLSRFQPAEIIKPGSFSVPMRKVGLTRKILMVAQFSISIILVIGSMVVYDQLRFIQNEDLGFEKDQILTVKLNRSITDDFLAFENELLQLPYIKSISTSSSVPGYRVMMEGVKEIGSDDEAKSSRLLFADETFIDTYDIDLVLGKHFNGNLQRDEENEFILNRRAAREFFGERNPVNKRISIAGDTGTVIGLVEDFKFQTLHNEVEPLTISNLPIALFGYASIKFEAASTTDVLSAIESASRKVYPDLPPLETEFLDDRFGVLYMKETRLQAIVWVFCLVTILLTVSGIFGVATYNAQKRSKEIAVRKVLGGSLLELLKQLTKAFVYLLLFALLIGLPGAYILSEWWLQDFAYRIILAPGIFIISALAMLLIVVLSSGFVTLKTVRTNPAEVLKNE